MDAGYRPCRRCRPDLLEFCPTEKLAENAKDVMNRYFADEDEIKKQIQRLGVNKSYLNKLLLKPYGKTMPEYLRLIRIRRAKIMLLEGATVAVIFAVHFGA
ncbi:hypothetical protein QBE52_12180 [Clostridiaceae bacterium 35-E11]